MLDSDGREIRVGDKVGWKDDYEEYGEVTGFSGGWVNVKTWNSLEGQYQERVVSARRMWHDEG